MSVVVNIGNQVTSFGIFSKNASHFFSIKTKEAASFIEYKLKLELKQRNLSIVHKQAIIISVVENFTTVYKTLLDKLTNKASYVVSPINFPFIKTKVDPTSVGADRLMNAFYANQTHKKNTLIIDIGTATTFDIIDENGIFIGGAITPGIKTMLRSLFQNTNKIKDIPLTLQTKTLLGKNTQEAVNSGLFYGHASLIDGMIRKLEQSLQIHLKKIATGGLATSIIPFCELQNEISIQKNLTLQSGALLAPYI